MRFDLLARLFPAPPAGRDLRLSRRALAAPLGAALAGPLLGGAAVARPPPGGPGRAGLALILRGMALTPPHDAELQRLLNDELLAAITVELPEAPLLLALQRHCAGRGGGTAAPSALARAAACRLPCRAAGQLWLHRPERHPHDAPGPAA